MRAPITIPALSLLVSLASAVPQAGDRGGEVQGDLPADLEIPPAPALSPADELKTFVVPPGFMVELVAAEPLVVDPVQVTYDELGRLWVVEMRGYMPDINGTGEREPVGRIAVLTDTDGDGAMDERVDFAKELVLPRGVQPMHGGALCLLPPELVFLRDDDGDGEFDVREVVATGLTKGLDNPEHDVNSPLLGLDNWIHFANWDVEVRRVFDEEGNASWEKRPCAGGGQWGLSMDDLGRLMRNTNPNPLYVDVVPSHYARRNSHQRRFTGAVMGVGAKNEVFPRRMNPGVNRGYQEVTLRDDFTLHYFTGACGPTVLRGAGLGDEANGDVFVCEPTGNLVKRYDLSPQAEDARLVAKSVHGPFDFLTSTDERFRPVAATTSPDGSLIVADFYRGLIQHRIFLTTFLRKQIEERGLAGPMGLGRIWRVRREDHVPAQPDADLLALDLHELVPLLASPNSWLRDQAQRLLVEQVDGEADVIARLRALAMEDNGLGAVHALWTLEGVGYLDIKTLLARLEAAPSEVVEVACYDLLVRFVDGDGVDVERLFPRERLAAMTPRAAVHAALTLGAVSRDEVALPRLAALLTRDTNSSLLRSAAISGLAYREVRLLMQLAGEPEWLHQKKGRAALVKELASCIGREGLQENMELVVDLSLDPPAEWWSSALLDGLYETRRKGPKGEVLPIALRAMPASLAARPAEEPAGGVAARIDEGCAWPGKPGAIEIEVPRDLTVDEVRQYDHGRTVFETVCATCHQSHGGGQVGKAPTLRGTQYVVGDETRLVRILLHGLEGELVIDGETWNQEMPRFEGSDVDLAAVATFIRRSFGNGADPVTLESVESARAASGERTRALSANEL